MHIGADLSITPATAAVFASAIAMYVATATDAKSAVPRPWSAGDKKAGIVYSVDRLSKQEREAPIADIGVARELPEQFKFGSKWQEPRLCGPNSLSVLLALCGHQIPSERVLELVPISEAGCTLADLSKAATSLGFPHRLLKVTPTELGKLRPPLLVHEELTGRQEGASAELGHFYVLCRVDRDGGMFFIDGVSGLYQYSHPGPLLRSFSGYVMVPDEVAIGLPFSYTLYGLTALVLLIVVLGLFLMKWWKKLRMAFKTS